MILNESSNNPNLFREVFPFPHLPKIAFDEEYLPINIPEDIWITDTTFRDGQQAREPYTVEQIEKLYKYMHKLGGPQGIIRATEFFLYNKKDREAVKNCQELGYEYPKITGWIRANVKDLELVKNTGITETGILSSLSDYHIYFKFGWTREKAINNHLNIAECCLNQEIIPRCHLEDATRSDIDKVILPFAKCLMKLSEEYGLPVKIRVCDTLGVGLPYPNVKSPRSIPKIMHLLNKEANVPSEWLEFHGHNDYHLSVVNSASAWLYGCSAVNGTLLSIGERAGNTPIEGMIFQILQLKPTLSINTRIINEIANYYKEIGYKIPDFYPLIGKNFNVTWAGIHVDGMIKHPEIYSSYDLELILNRPYKSAIGQYSGSSGVAWKINELLEIPRSEWITKDNHGIQKIVEIISFQYDEGRVTTISDSEILKLVHYHLPELWEHYNVNKKDEFDTTQQYIKEVKK
ncbi:2-isopropylmalate synthase [Candidatus Bathyarchaeota archaeon]|nr:2-isopropylmalate synthase [Candidatus Bathyarchaeota archaeon]